MGRDNTDILKVVCSFEEGSIFPGMADVVKEDSGYRAISFYAVEEGCRDIIDKTTGRRFITSPFNFSEIFQRTPAHPLIKFPSFLGQADTKDGICYVFEIPASAISLEVTPDLKRIVGNAKGSGSPFEFFPDVIKDAKEKYPDLAPEIFDDPVKYWASDSEGGFILIFPFTGSDGNN